METTLVIMAAGIGSRFGGGIKQLEPVDEMGHIIIDYSVHDAVEAGFNKIIFVIRRDIENDFKEIIGNRIERICIDANVKVEYAFQELNDIPDCVPQGRSKPWGTGHAVLAAKSMINGPFAVINADDYYGKNGFKILHSELCSGKDEAYLVGFVLKNTLSDNGSVTRGICKTDNNYLTEIHETKNILKIEGGAISNDNIIDVNSVVSMNMWGFNLDYIKQLENDFAEFFKSDVVDNPLSSEFLIPIHIGKLLNKQAIKVRVLHTDDVWYGMTYREDVPVVKTNFENLVRKGLYTKMLFDDICKGVVND